MNINDALVLISSLANKTQFCIAADGSQKICAPSHCGIGNPDYWVAAGITESILLLVVGIILNVDSVICTIIADTGTPIFHDGRRNIMDQRSKRSLVMSFGEII